MGLKFRKFKAKLNWKTKEKVPDVMCLRYHIHSEFDNAIVPVPTSSTQIGTSDVIKQKKPALKPSVQSVFESTSHTSPTSNTSSPTTSTPTTSIPNIPTSITSIPNASIPIASIPNPSIPNPATPANANVNNINDKTKTNGVLTTNQNTAAATREPVPTKGILKKSVPDANIEENKWNQNDASNTDDYKKSALIFMTENHEDGEEPADAEYNTKVIKKELDLGVNAGQGITERNSTTTVIAHKEVETGEFSFCKTKEVQQEITKLHFYTTEDEDIVPRKDNANRSDSESEEGDVKTVRWRETVIEIKSPTLEIVPPKFEESAEDFQVHFVKHPNISKTSLQSEGAETEESESEDNDQPQMDSYYGNRGAYSSQAASIFFAGEEPEPPARVRHVSRQQDDDVHSSV